MNEMVCGIHAVQAILKNTPEQFQKVFILKGQRNKRLSSLTDIIRKKNIEIQLVTRQYLDKKIANIAAHQGIIAIIKTENRYHENNLLDLVSKFDYPFLLILDRITDSRNLGSCLRSANAAGVHVVIVPKDRSAQINAATKKVACGAAENMPFIRVKNLSRTMRMLRKENIWIVGATRKANNILYQSKMVGRMALVIGSEDVGIRRLTLEHCDELIRIPMVGDVPSLNVSVATGICLFEAVRQRTLS